MSSTTTYGCRHVTQAGPGPAVGSGGSVVQFTVRALARGVATAIQLRLCRPCVLGLTGYPVELTATLDAAITGKRFGRLELTLQHGVPGVVHFTDTSKVASWQPWEEQAPVIEKGEL